MLIWNFVGSPSKLPNLEECSEPPSMLIGGFLLHTTMLLINQEIESKSSILRQKFRGFEQV